MNIKKEQLAKTFVKKRGSGGMRGRGVGRSPTNLKNPIINIQKSHFTCEIF